MHAPTGPSPAPDNSWSSLALPVCLGGSVFGWLIERRESEAILDRFFEIGGRLIDTADGYSADRRADRMDSESIIGEWARTRGVASEIRVCTKVGRSPDLPGLSQGSVAAALDASLGRLGLMTLEAVLAHGDDSSMGPEEIADSLDYLARHGAKRIGISNFSDDRAAAVHHASSFGNRATITVIQEEYSLSARALETTRAWSLRTAGVNIMATGVLAQGFLTGKFRGATTRVGHRQQMATARFADQRFDAILDAAGAAASSLGVSVAAVALRWVGSAASVLPVVSVTSPEQLRAFTEMAGLTLPDHDVASLDNASRFTQEATRPATSG